jgi:hypothetical protein
MDAKKDFQPQPRTPKAFGGTFSGVKWTQRRNDPQTKKKIKYPQITQITQISFRDRLMLSGYGTAR